MARKPVIIVDRPRRYDNAAENPLNETCDVRAVSIAPLTGPGQTVALTDRASGKTAEVKLDSADHNKKNDKAVANAAKALSSKKGPVIFWS